MIVLCVYKRPLKSNTHFYMYRVYVTLCYEKIQDYVYNNIRKEHVLLYNVQIKTHFQYNSFKILTQFIVICMVRYVLRTTMITVLFRTPSDNDSQCEM
jgi:hypothetical protein